MSELQKLRMSRLRTEAESRGIHVPTAATLKKYGLTEEEWLERLAAQGWVCPIMRAVPSTGFFVIDHEHVRGWKNMPPEQRKQYVRGIVSRFANGKFLARGLSLERAERVVQYLREYQNRRPA